MRRAILLAAGLLATAGSAFKITTYEDANCTGATDSYRIYDSTCHPDINVMVQSFRAESYGGDHQKGYFYRGNDCLLLDDYKTYWVGGDSDEYVLGNCYNLPFVPTSIGSQLG